MRNVYTVISAAFALLLSNAAPGQSGDDPLNEIVVVANRIPIAAKQVGTSISVLTETDIAARGNPALTDVMRQLPAVGVSRNGGMGAATSLRIRGEEGFRTLVLFDGLKLSDPSTTQTGPHLQHLMSAGIEKVEILRGPQGLSYGADAGGVINITSRRLRQGVEGSLDAYAGGFGTGQAAANLSGGTNRFDFHVSGVRFRTDGFNTRDTDTAMDDDGYDNTSLHGRVGVDVNERLRLDLVHRDVEGETDFDGCFSGDVVHDCTANYELEATRLSARYSGAGTTHSLAYSSTASDRENFALGVSGFTAAGKLERWEYLGLWRDLPGFDLVFGVDLEEESNNGVDRDNNGYYVEALGDFSDKLFLTAGIRRDDNDDFGEHTSYRLTGAYLIDTGPAGTLKFKASYGTGFRAPSPFEVAYNAGASAFPPASRVSLREEISEGYEIGAEYYAGTRLKLEAVYFDQKVENAIFFDLAGFSGYLQDTGVGSSRGVELSGEFEATANWNLTANYTFNETERPNGLQRRRRPENLANIGASYRSDDGRFAFNAFYRISADAVDETRGVPVALEDFDVLDVSARYRLTSTLEIYARLENALDEEYQEIVDFNSADRAFYAGVRFDF